MDEAFGVESCSEQSRETAVDIANWQLLCGVWQLQSPKEVSSTVWYVLRHAGKTHLLYMQVVQLLRDANAGKVTPQAQQALVQCLSNNVCLQYAPEQGYSRCCHFVLLLLYNQVWVHILHIDVDAAVCLGRLFWRWRKTWKSSSTNWLTFTLGISQAATFRSGVLPLQSLLMSPLCRCQD